MIPRTHDLDYLVEQLSDLGIGTPESLTRCDWLTPWGVLFRYDAEPDDLDRTAGVKAAAAAIALASESINA